MCECFREIEKWRLVEGDMYKKMFGSKTAKQPLAIETSTQKKEVKLKENDPNFKTKVHMIKMLKYQFEKCMQSMSSFRRIIEFYFNLAISPKMTS